VTGKLKQRSCDWRGREAENSLRYRSHISGNCCNSGFFASAIDASVARRELVDADDSTSF
jgi:hypothetical protein